MLDADGRNIATANLFMCFNEKNMLLFFLFKKTDDFLFQVQIKFESMFQN